ncbi:glycosyltransferase family 4 protein, partial [Holdemanella sp.]|uniref:glycosyltransferase family 4 protein n=1 Tax=Holdemanella sp. TaxID=1971762 RepID=UPI00307993C3
SKYYGIQNVEVITPYYGIDFDAVQNIHVEKEENSICFVGLMSRSENHEAAMRLIHIVQDLPNDLNVKLNIIGAYPNDELKSFESSRIHITGFVDSIEEEILKNELAVFPLMHGAGIKFKILLSAGLGLPVITTDIGAEGIDEEGEYVSLVKTDDEFKSEIIKYIDNDELRKEKAKQVKDYVLDNFNWEKTENLFDTIYR